MNTTYRRWLASLLVPLITASCGGGTDAPDTDARTQSGASHESTQAVSARLTTPWTAAAQQAAVPLPEYPRPQLTRADWLNLNGTWSYNGGSAAPNADSPPATAPGFPANPEQIKVPYPVESYLSGIQRMNDRNLWYKRTFTVPVGWN